MKYTYFAFSAARGLKIGQSCNPLARIKQINCGSNEFAEFFAVEASVLSEKQAHDLLKNFRTEGEFFDLTLDDVRSKLKSKGINNFLDRESLSVVRPKSKDWSSKIRKTAIKFNLDVIELRNRVVELGLREWLSQKEGRGAQDSLFNSMVVSCVLAANQSGNREAADRMIYVAQQLNQLTSEPVSIDCSGSRFVISA